jgi:putative tricarboxylic transport membrane protein
VTRLGVLACVLALAANGACTGREGARAGAASENAADGYPRQRLDWTIAFGPGGGNDRLSRTLIEILRRYEIYTPPIVATNRPAGSGAQGWGWLFARPGDPYQISSISGSFVTLPLQADVPWTPGDFTPVGLLAMDDMVLAVPAASDILDFAGFITRARTTRPAIGGVGSLGVDYMIVRRLGETAAFEPRYVAFNEMGSLVTAALSRSLDALVANPGEIRGLLESGELRALAFTGEATPGWLGATPTFGALGYADAAIRMPRGIVLPPGVEPAIRDWWVGALQKAVETPEWKAFVESSTLSPDVRWGDDFAAFLADLSRTLGESYGGTGAGG